MLGASVGPERGRSVGSIDGAEESVNFGSDESETEAEVAGTELTLVASAGPKLGHIVGSVDGAGESDTIGFDRERNRSKSSRT